MIRCCYGAKLIFLTYRSSMARKSMSFRKKAARILSAFLLHLTLLPTDRYCD